MTPTALTDAAITRLIRRMLVSRTTTSDTLLVVADGLDDAAAHAHTAEASAMLRAHAATLRGLAPYMADDALAEAAA